MTRRKTRHHTGHRTRIHMGLGLWRVWDIRTAQIKKKGLKSLSLCVRDMKMVWTTERCWKQSWVRRRRGLTGVRSSCLRNAAASSRPSYSAWLWSRFLKTFCNKTDGSHHFHVRYSEEDGALKLIWNQDAGWIMTAARTGRDTQNFVALPLFGFKGDAVFVCCKRNDPNVAVPADVSQSSGAEQVRAS